MSVPLMCRVLKLEISSTEKLVLMAMADHAHKDGTGCYASVDTLAKETSLTRRAVQLTIDKLEERGLIVPLGKVRGGRRVATSEFGRGVTMEYKIALPDRPEAKQKDEPKGRTTFTLSSTGKGEPRSQKGRTTFARKGESRSPESKTLNQLQNQPLAVFESVGHTRVGCPNTDSKTARVQTSQEKTHATSQATTPLDTFWENYPTAKNWPSIPLAVLRAWMAIDGDAHLGEILNGLESWKKSDQWQTERFIKDPGKFLAEKKFLVTPPSSRPAKPAFDHTTLKRL